MKFCFIIFSALIALTPLKGWTIATLPPLPTDFAQSGFGTAWYGAELVKKIQFNGNVKLDGTQVSGLVAVNGRLDASNTTIGMVQVNGATKLSDSQVEENCVVNGPLRARDCLFKGDMSVASHKVELASSQAHSIIIRKLQADGGPQVLKLVKGSLVRGDIIFEGGGGRVIVDSNSRILGRVQGGAIEKQKPL